MYFKDKETMNYIIVTINRKILFYLLIYFVPSNNDVEINVQNLDTYGIL